MNAAQISFLIALSNPADPSDPSQYIKTLQLGSGRIYSIHSQIGVAGRYTVTFDNGNELVAFTPVVPASDGPEIVPAVEYSDYDNIELMSFFTP